MRALAVAVVLCIGALAQQRGGFTPGVGRGAPGRGAFVPGITVGSTYGSSSGFGNVVFPGTGRPPIVSDPTFAGRLGATVSGFPPYTGAPIGGYGRRVPLIVYPWVYPTAYPYVQTQPVVVEQTGPQVIINQNFVPEVARPVVREYVTDPSDGVRIYEAKPRAQAEPPAQEEKRSYLIAFKDHTIYAAFAYWMEGETLHYVTTHGTHNQVSLDLVDRELSERLNRERNVEFKLPARR